MQDVGNKLIAWIGTGAGTLLVYSAIKNRNPLDVLRDVEGSPLSGRFVAPRRGSGNFAGSGEPGSGSYGGGGLPLSSIPRLRMIANREIQPELVAIKPFGRLERSAAESKARIDAKLGYIVPITSGYRSYASQAAGHASNPDRFADPNRSLHVVGLALDVHSAYANKPEVVEAFTSEGWHRYDPVNEFWHYSYGVRG